MLREWLDAVLKRDNKGNDAERRLGKYLDDETACAILRLIVENPGASTETLVDRSHADVLTTTGYLARLGRDGLIVMESDYGRPGYYIAEDAKMAIVEHLPLNYQCPGMKRE